MNPTSKIFVAGGTGMVGTAIIKRLLAAGYENIIANCFSKEPVTNYESRVTFIRLDLTRQADVEAFFEKEQPEYIFLAAAKVGGILANSTYKADFIYENIMIASNVIHAAYRFNAKKLLNLGSSCIYPKLAPQPMKEEHLLTGTLEPTNEPYAVAKIAAIKLCLYYNEQYGTNFISVMPTNLYGPHDNFDLQNSHVLPAMIRKFHEAKKRQDKEKVKVKAEVKMKSKEMMADTSEEAVPVSSTLTSTSACDSSAVTLWGTGSPCREFLHVDDLADACVFLMERYNAAQIGEFVNVGTGSDLTIKDLAEMIRKIVGFEGAIVWDRTRPDGTPRKLLDISRLKALGWEPKTALEDGIRKTYEWYVNSLQAGKL
ncbi:MAG: GDP-L-fucose synthase [Nitrospirae bacterium]|nr:GDP-L-fucose synthase [Nitrospirota bacterium]